MELTDIKGVGPKTLKHLQDLNIEKLEDLLTYFPFRYDIYEPINIPLDYIEQINISFDREIIVYCQSGVRSKEAALKLLELGYENVKNMGGINNYNYKLED